MTTLRERCAGIALLVADVDGVLTEGGILYGTSGLEMKRFHVRDGSALKAWREAGKRAAIITGRSSSVVDVRSAELGIEFVLQGVRDKLAAYRQLLSDAGLQPARVCYVGDDLADVPPLRSSGLAVAVADACAEVRAAAHYVTRTAGGRGAVREAVEMVLRSQGRWHEDDLAARA